LDRLRRADIPVVMIRGNHDAEGLMSRKLSLPQNVTILSARKPETVELKQLGVAIHGQSFATRVVTENLVPAYPEPRAGWFNIGLLHTSADGRPGHDPYAPCELRDLAAKGYDYWALGHIHTREVLCRDPWVVFPGNLQGRHVNEPGAKGFSIVTVEGGRVQDVEHVCADVVRWGTVQVDASGATAVEELRPRVEAALDATLAQAEGRTLAVRLVLRGDCPAHKAFVGDPDRLAAECEGLALQARGDVWIERVVLDTRLPAEGAEAADLSDIRQLVTRVRERPEDAGAIRDGLERGLGKLGTQLRAQAGLETLTDEHFQRIMSDAESVILHRIAEGAARA
jgi:DNA repair exonuclease SbcCD nuclease subunit